MKHISIDQLQANHFYWARRKPAGGFTLSEQLDLEIIKVSTVFGTAPEFWTAAAVGTDEHFDLEAYEFLHKVPAPLTVKDQRALLARGENRAALVQ